MKMKVAGIQMTCLPEREDNVRKAIRLGTMAAESGARIICYQPLFSTRWFPRSPDETALTLAERDDGPTLGALRSTAARLGVCLILPLFEQAEGGRFYTAFIIGAQGEILGKYRKVHLPDIPLWRERYFFSPGDTGFPVFHFEGLTFGVQICWDNFFPEGARLLALGGASIIFAPTAAAFDSYRRWETVMLAGAIVNGLYLMRVNRVGSEEEQDFYGRSFCVDPEGEFLIGPIGLNDGVVMAELDTAENERARSQWSFLADRRPETYGPLAGSPAGDRLPPAR